MPAPFVHLHCHTDYSLLDGACEISQLMDLAVEQKMPAVAMTDHGNLFGAVEFYNEAKEKGVHPVIGCEVYVAQQGHKVKSESNRYNHLVLLCENQEGYRNLIQLVSTGYLDGFYYKPRIDKDLLSRHSKGLIALSACLRGDINETLLADRYDDATQAGLRIHRPVRPEEFLPGTCRITAWNPTSASCRWCTAWRPTPEFRWWPPTIRTICARTMPARMKSCCASRPARPCRIRIACASRSTRSISKRAKR